MTGEWTLPAEGELATAAVEVGVMLAPDEAGTSASFARHFVDSIPGALFTRRPDDGTPSTWLSPLAHRTVAAFTGDSIVHLLAERPELRWYGADGQLLRTASWDQPSQRLAGDLRFHYEDKRASVRNDGATATEIDFMLPGWSSWAGANCVSKVFGRTGGGEDADGALGGRLPCSTRRSYSSMSHRLQVLLDEDEIARIRAGARRHRVTVSEYVRQALREGDAREPSLDAARKLMIVREAATLSYPTADIDEMESDIVRGYLDDG